MQVVVEAQPTLDDPRKFLRAARVRSTYRTVGTWKIPDGMPTRRRVHVALVSVPREISLSKPAVPWVRFCRLRHLGRSPVRRFWQWVKR